jgi:hypothetical protein
MNKTQRIIVLLVSALSLLLLCGACGGWGCRASSSNTLGNVTSQAGSAEAGSLTTM